MISNKNFAKKYLNQIRSSMEIDPAILERTIYALALLEALVKVNTPLIFKGGTSLLLLLEQSYRLSTDIDIIVEPETDITHYLNAAAAIFPFKSVKQHHRKEHSGIKKQHFKFTYDSLIQRGELSILLDIIYEKNPYTKLVNKKISHPFLITKEPYIEVFIPSIDCILGDKLTAFAPYTTGIGFGIGKELEIIKQLFDIAVLYDAHENYKDVVETYHAMVITELAYRRMEITVEKVLEDTIVAAACIASRGKYKRRDYQKYLIGIRGLANHVYGQKFNAEKAVLYAAKCMYVATCILKKSPFQRITDFQPINISDISNSPFPVLSKVRKLDSEAFAYIAEACRILQN